MTKNLNYLLPEFKNYVLVVANGQFPQDLEIITFFKQSKLIIACDGALKNLLKTNIIADYVVGDGDSIKSVDKAVAKHPYIYDPDQNTTDLTKAINFIHREFRTKHPIVITAASGLREDHSVANVALLAQYADTFDRIVMLSDYGIFQVCKKGHNSVSSIIGQQISFFALNMQTRISCNNLKWPLHNHKFRYLNSGTLNQATSDTLEILCDAPTLLYRAFEIKIQVTKEV